MLRVNLLEAGTMPDFYNISTVDTDRLVIHFEKSDIPREPMIAVESLTIHVENVGEWNIGDVRETKWDPLSIDFSYDKEMVTIERFSTKFSFLFNLEEVGGDEFGIILTQLINSFSFLEFF